MTIYCYDTEFLEDGETIDLISIGIVCEDGREYYAVNSDMDKDRIKRNDWLCQNVIPHLPLVGFTDKDKRPRKSDNIWIYALDSTSALVKPKWVIANEVRDFMLAGVDTSIPTGASINHPELWAYYAAYDHVVLAQLWGRMINLPKGIPMYTHDLKQEMDRLGVLSGEVPQPANAHNALADARWNFSMLNHLRNFRAN